MADIHIPNPSVIEARRRKARISRHLPHIQLMLLASGLAALTIIAVAAAMMTTLL